MEDEGSSSSDVTTQVTSLSTDCHEAADKLGKPQGQWKTEATVALMLQCK
jgi:hypothetical protein